jgi:hypothetical protein
VRIPKKLLDVMDAEGKHGKLTAVLPPKILIVDYIYHEVLKLE